ncbi:Alpha/Beta hydrolase protein [Butyriboletus roseoflavus]|nr:Alpha/Beta hydrolase protein [Butyriboletus roseoflavus]
MGKLNIAHHKSYHPYRRDNIERVRKDEEEAARKDAEQEGRIALADAEARLVMLRDRAGIDGKGKEKADKAEGPASAGVGPGAGAGIGSGKHINLFEDLEQQATMTAIRATKKTTPSETEKGIPLAPSAKDLNPWYSDKAKDRGQVGEDQEDVKRQRDLRVKSMNDPLTSITQQLATRPSSQPSLLSNNSRPRNQRFSRHPDHPPASLPPLPKQLDPTTARLNRESSERERALALIRRKKRELAGSETPSTVHGGMDDGYGDVYNKRAVEEAHAHRDKWRRKGCGGNWPSNFKLVSAGTVQLSMPIAPPVLNQSIYVVSTFTLENGCLLRDVPVAYKTWGRLNESRDNVMIICHAFTGSADVEDWWGPLMGRGKAFDPNRFFIFCANVLGSPYGTASPITPNPDTGRPYGPEFPQTSIRDDIRLHKRVLDHLGVSRIAVAIGGSMGGMAVLEWPLCSPPGYIRHIIPLATSSRHSAWCISWGEAQRQCIYSDPTYEDGYYISQPSSGLAAARMAALLTYRSRDSFESRFGRRPQVPPASSPNAKSHTKTTPPLAFSATDQALIAHNEGHQRASRRHSQAHCPPPPQTVPHSPTSDHIQHSPSSSSSPPPSPPVFSAQSYLRYQGAKFVARFDANCYIHITRKMDTHDLARGRADTDANTTNPCLVPQPSTAQSSALAAILTTLPPRALVISIETDGLFTPTEQRELATHIPDAELVVIPSPDGHDGFLLEFEQINRHVLGFLRREFPEHYYERGVGEEGTWGDFAVKKTSLFGEAEADVTRW